MTGKRVTNPLTPEEISQALFEIPEEEFLEQFDDIFSPENRPETLEQLITLDDYMEQELREMFQSIISQYLDPIEFAIQRFGEGDQSKRTTSEALDAVAPIINAAETLEYDDISGLLRGIEGPLREVHEGTRKRLTKREVVNLKKAWDDFVGLVRKEPIEQPEPQQSGVVLGTLPRYVDGVTATEVRKLRAAGITTLREIAMAPVEDVAAVAGLSSDVALRIHAFATGALAAGASRASTPQVRAGMPAGWMRVSIDSDVFKGRLTFEYSILAKYLEPILARLSEGDDSTAQVARRPRAKTAKTRARKS